MAEYVWVDATGGTRSKSRVSDFCHHPVPSVTVKRPALCPTGSIDPRRLWCHRGAAYESNAVAVRRGNVQRRDVTFHSIITASQLFHDTSKYLRKAVEANFRP